MDARYELIDALIDQEDADASELRRVLDEPEARDYLVDAYALRRAVMAERGLDADLRAPATTSSSRKSNRPLILSLAVAASLAAGFVSGRATVVPTPGATDGPPSVVTTAGEPPSAFPAPAPTRVIQVEFTSGAPLSGGD